MKFINDNEIVGRAFFEPQWDDGVKRPSPGVFTKNNTSVTRQLTLTEEQMINILKSDVENDRVIVRAIGLITVAGIKAIGQESQPEKIFFEVTEDPTANNPNHGEIIPFEDEEKLKLRQKVPRGVSGKIGKSLSMLILESSGDIVERIPPEQ